MCTRTPTESPGANLCRGSPDSGSTSVADTTREGNTVEVSVSYPFELIFPGLGDQHFTIEASATAVIQ